MCPSILLLITYLRNIVGKTCEASYPTLGVSRRGSQMLYRASQIMAFLEGCDCCTSELSKPLAFLLPSSSPARDRKFALHFHPEKSERAEPVLREIVESAC